MGNNNNNCERERAEANRTEPHRTERALPQWADEVHARERVSREREPLPAKQLSVWVVVVVAVAAAVVAFVMPFTLSGCLAGNCKCCSRYATTVPAKRHEWIWLVAGRTPEPSWASRVEPKLRQSFVCIPSLLAWPTPRRRCSHCLRSGQASECLSSQLSVSPSVCLCLFLSALKLRPQSRD